MKGKYWIGQIFTSEVVRRCKFFHTPPPPGLWLHLTARYAKASHICTELLVFGNFYPLAPEMLLHRQYIWRFYLAQDFTRPYCTLCWTLLCLSSESQHARHVLPNRRWEHLHVLIDVTFDPQPTGFICPAAIAATLLHGNLRPRQRPQPIRHHRVHQQRWTGYLQQLRQRIVELSLDNHQSILPTPSQG